MAWQDYEHDMQRCTRCSYCKWIPWRYMHNSDFMQGCPSATRYLWHAYAAGGKFNMGYSLLKERIEIDETFLDVVYKCMMGGGCDFSCKVQQDIEPLQLMQELRIKCVEDGQLVPAHMIVIEGLRKEDNMMQSLRAEPGCGGRASELGYAGELTKYAEHQAETFRTAGVKALVTPCSDCYACFKVLYDKIGKKLDLEVLHITQYLERLIKEGKLKLRKKVPMK